MELLWIEEDAGLGERAIACDAGTSGPSSLAPVVRLADYGHLVVRAVMALIFCFVAGDIEPARAAGPAANVDAARIDGADQDPANWMTYGRTYSEQRFSPLTQITADNVNLLGLAWYADFRYRSWPRGNAADHRRRDVLFRPRGVWSEHSMPRPADRYGHMIP
jgi:hypothetical protein